MQAMRNHSHPCPSTRSSDGHKWMKGNEVRRMGSPSDSRDEGLALFQDIQSRDLKNFLHPFMDDIEISLSTKLSSLGYATPQTPPWKGNDLLATTDAEKTDYDWLLTPPGTPLFPSLDKDSMQAYMEQNVIAAQASCAPRTSRVHKSLSGSNMSDLHNRMARRSPSPRTPSSSTSSSSTFIMRGRAPSPSKGGSSPTSRPSTPVKSLGRSTTMTKVASTRSSPPTLRRTNTSPSVRSSSAERNGHLPKGRSRGPSISPKLQAWQAPELGFSTAPPPNLRTSMSDRPLAVGSRRTTARSRPAAGSGQYGEARHSYSEGVDTRNSPWCHSSSSSASKFSSCTTSQDHWSSRGSIISSSDDGMDAMESTFLGSGMTSPSSTSGTSRLVVGQLDTDVCPKYCPATSQPKRPPNSDVIVSARKSLEPSMQRVDHRHVSQNMFRPLLSSAPTTSFHNIGRTAVRHRPTTILAVVEPSITASSNARSEKGVRIFPCNESSDEGEDDEAGRKWDGGPHPQASDIPALEIDGIQQESTSSHIALSEGDMATDINTNYPSADEALARIKIPHMAASNEATYNNPSPPLSTSKADECDSSPVVGPGHIVSPHQTTQHHTLPPSPPSNVDECLNLIGHCHMAAPQQAPNTDECDSMIGPGSMAALRQEIHHNPSPLSPTRTDECDYVIDPGQVASHRQATHLNPSLPPPGNMDDCGNLVSSDHPTVFSLQSATHKAANEISTDVLEDLTLHSKGIPCSIQSHTSYCDTSDPKSLVQGLNSNCMECSNLDPESLQSGNESFAGPSVSSGSERNPPDAKENITNTNSGHILGDSRGVAPCLHSPMSALPMPFSELQDANEGEGETGPIGKSSDHHLNSQKSCIDMPQAMVRESKTYSLDKLTKRLSVCGRMDEEESAVSNAFQIDTHANSMDANMVDEDDIHNEQTERAMVPHEATKDTISREEEESTLFMNHNPFSLESTTGQLVDTGIAQQGYSSMEHGGDGDGFSEECIARDILEDGCDFDQIKQPRQSPNGWVEGQLLPEEGLPSLEDPPSPGALEALPEHPCSSKTRSHEGDASQTDQEEMEAPGNTSLLVEGQEQPLPKESPSSTCASQVLKPAPSSFSLEEATNTILFCSSIVHDLVYKATYIAAEKEAMAEAVEISYCIRGKSPNTGDYISSLRGKASISGAWKAAKKEVKPSAKRPHNAAVIDVQPVAITHHPMPIVGMEKGNDQVMEVNHGALPTATVKEKNYLKFSVSSNCQCAVM